MLKQIISAISFVLIVLLQSSNAQGGSLNAFELIKSKEQWASKLALVLRQGKIDPEIFYCHIDIAVFGDPDSLNCQFARGRLNLVSYQSNLGTLPENDREIVPLVCAEIFKQGMK